MTEHFTPRKAIWTRRNMWTVGVAVGVSVVPFVLLNLWICGRAEDHLQCVRKSVPFWVGALLFIAGILGLQLLWKLISWASDLSGLLQVRLVKVAVLVLSAAGPLLLMARPDMDYAAIGRSVANPWFVAFMVFVGYVSWPGRL